MHVAELLSIPTARRFLMSPAALDAFAEFPQRYGMEEGRETEFLSLIEAYLEGQLAAADMPAVIAEAFGVTEEVAQKVAADVLGFGVLPLLEFVPNVAKDIAALGGKEDAYPKERIGRPTRSFAAAARACAESAQITMSDFLVQRLAFLLTQRVNGGKTTEAMRVFFGRPLPIGGLGLAKEQVDALSAAVEGLLAQEKLVEEEEIASASGLAKTDLSIDPVIASDPSPSLRGAEGDEAISSDIDLAAAEADAMDRRFVALTKTVPRERVQPILPGARVSAARTATQEAIARARSIPDADVAQPKQNKKAVAELTVGSVPPSSNRPATDVVRGTRLVGPVDELRTMSLTEFRRLAPDARAATKKVEEILAALESTAYEDRVRGVAAWHESPVCRLYAAMTSQALTEGRSVAEIAAARRSAGEESMSPAEINAIVELNTRLQM